MLSMLTILTHGRWHRDGAYSHLMSEGDGAMLQAVREFNPYDLYSKTDNPPNVQELRPYYEGLIARYFPPVLSW
jgi:inositol oxygenase